MDLESTSRVVLPQQSELPRAMIPLLPCIFTVPAPASWPRALWAGCLDQMRDGRFQLPCTSTYNF